MLSAISASPWQRPSVQDPLVLALPPPTLILPVEFSTASMTPSSASDVTVIESSPNLASITSRSPRWTSTSQSAFRQAVSSDGDGDGDALGEAGGGLFGEAGVDTGGGVLGAVSTAPVRSLDRSGSEPHPASSAAIERPARPARAAGLEVIPMTFFSPERNRPYAARCVAPPGRVTTVVKASHGTPVFAGDAPEPPPPGRLTWRTAASVTAGFIPVRTPGPV
ncbi:hypothetical protein GCM10009530_61690 [Microbispora corallina]|uniref:Uncharacterized protein n=1 Tax=Microbispora corallina TaxID=83302 RepID=A0ABQ4G8D9_9ACTN|nr:hypothetical protein Mco01_63540 [Microbispora corallina]